MDQSALSHVAEAVKYPRKEPNLLCNYPEDVPGILVFDLTAKTPGLLKCSFGGLPEVPERVKCTRRCSRVLKFLGQLELLQILKRFLL